MRYAKGRKDDTRRRIVTAASRRFRKDGIAATGIAGLMADAGLTHGGFYAHFASKDDLVGSAIDAALRRTREILAAAARKAHDEGRDGLEAIVDSYLETSHRDRPESGCAAACLATELARSPKSTREILAHDVDAIIAIIAAEIRAVSPEAAHDAASAIFSLMMGSLQLARMTPAAGASEAMLAAGRAACLALARCARQRLEGNPGKLSTAE
jgi:TetR/AcrR family transcriptional repressor of nem operon